MKKTAVILLTILLLLVSACKKENTAEKATETKQETVSTFETVLIATEDSVTAKSETAKVSEKAIKNETATTGNLQSTKALQQNSNEVAPYILSVSLNDLKKIKLAAESMNEEEFVKYMDENFPNETMNGMYSLESTNSILAELNDLYIIYVDETDRDNDLHFYIESHFLIQSIEMRENVFIRSRIYTDSRDTFEYKDGDIVKHIKTCEIGDLTFELYENTAEESEGIYGNIKSDKGNIPFFTSVKISVEELEMFLPKIKVAKIADLLAE